MALFLKKLELDDRLEGNLGGWSHPRAIQPMVVWDGYFLDNLQVLCVYGEVLSD